MPTSAWPPKPGRPPTWCSQQCRRAAYEERRAAANGAVAVRVEVVEKPVERIGERVRVETTQIKSSRAEAVQIVLNSPRACRAVLEALAAEADSGGLNTTMHAATLRAAQRLLSSLERARLIDG
ncbi:MULTISPECIES: hypothetical protein [Mycobacterium]|uniref:hypothetical protein n=1 Tax=Mycobacterium TaxID=1763 RepID=UPI001EEF8CFA|nr:MULTISPECIES: hypothetical protein [Mycobacterium]